jgi:hypothetical protein
MPVLVLLQLLLRHFDRVKWPSRVEPV